MTGSAGLTSGPGPVKPVVSIVAELLADGGAEEADRALPAVRCVDAADPLVDVAAPAAGDLHRAGVDVARLRVPGSRLALLDDGARHAEAGELEGGGEANRASADDEDAWRFRHVASRRLCAVLSSSQAGPANAASIASTVVAPATSSASVVRVARHRMNAPSMLVMNRIESSRAFFSGRPSRHEAVLAGVDPALEHFGSRRPRGARWCWRLRGRPWRSGRRPRSRSGGGVQLRRRRRSARR